MGKIYHKPRIEEIKIDQEIVMMAPSTPEWKPGDENPPWVGNPDHPDHPSNKPKNKIFNNPLEQNTPFGGDSVF
ncbi:hypothetical protein [Saccharicrinis aurantiacus]|uniref:hypothetical protein n=1 Tax=Saccharicrinis aurantiacus TaxID=1849719 RepID=UPI002491E8BC|nr:hypothetical protein [Saccharicrinis aurantiacus]